MGTSIDMNNKVSTVEMHDILLKSVKTLINNPVLAKALPPIIIRGSAGVGKSSIVRSIVDELNADIAEESKKLGFVDIRLAQQDRVDIAGLPSVKDGVTTWNVPENWPRDPNSRGIIFLDEITAAPADVQVAAYSIILDRCIPNSKYRIPDGWYIVAAGNGVKDHAVAKTMSSALANRFMHFQMDASVSDWIPWAVSHDIHPSVTGFMKYRPCNLFKVEGQNLEQGWPSPRSWERVSNMIKIFGGDDSLNKIVAGLVGDQVAIEFMAFHKLTSSFDDVLEMMEDPESKIKIPEHADEKCAFASAVSYLLWDSTNEETIDKRVTGMYRIVLEMTADFATMIVKSAMLGNSKVSRTTAALKIARHPMYAEFNKKFGDAFRKAA